MDFRATQVVSMAVSTMLDELSWMPCGDERSHTPIMETPDDVRKLELLLDMLDTLSRLMDTRIPHSNSDGKLIREWVEKIIEINFRYQRELELLAGLEEKSRTNAASE